MRYALAIIFVTLLTGSALQSAAPPSLINYQGVLRDASGSPRTGSFDMVFRFYSASAAGTFLLTDTHNTAAPSGQVTVSAGLFTAQLGAGTIAAGSEPDLAEMLRDNAAVWLEIEVDGETLTPRVRVLASAYAQNASSLQGAVNVSPAGNVGVGTTAPTARLTVNGGTLDAEQLTGNEADPVYTSWQSFTPGITGHLIRISFNSVLDYGSRTLEIRTGEGTGGTLLHSQTVDLVTGMEDYDLTAMVPMTAGSKYTWSVGDTAHYLWRSSTDTYAGGRCSLNAGQDFVFRTYIAPTTSLVVVGGTHLKGPLLDQSANAGTAGQILQTTGNGTDWVDPSSIADGDWTITGSDMVSNVSGNVGIGAAVPAAKLHVSAAAPEVRVENPAWVVGQKASLTFMHSARYAGINSYLPGANDVDLQFTTTNSSTPATAMVLTGNGNLGIGTASPGHRLVVSEDACFQDQANTAYTDASLTWGFWQSFRPAVGGYLCKVKLGYGTAYGEVDTFTLEVRSGVGNGGALLYSKSGLITQQWGFDTQVTLDTPLWLVPEQDYTLVVIHSGTNMGHVHVDESNSYARGQSSFSGADIEFTTSMNYNTGGVPTLIAGSGLVGIGTSTPVNWLDVGGSAAIGSGYAGTVAAPVDGLLVEGRVGIGTASATLAVPLTVQGAGSNSELVQFKDNTGTNQWHMNLRNGGLNISESGASDFRLYIQDAGNVGIGTDAPTERLTVKGDVNIFNSSNAQRAWMGVNADGAGELALAGANGSNKVRLHTATADGNRGAIDVYDSAGTAQCGIYVDLSGNGIVWGDTKSFRAANPRDPQSEIWYASVEGPEAAAYLRGTARLENGRAEVAFPEHFQDVVVPVGMTVQLTPRSDRSLGLAVVETGAGGFTVRELNEGMGDYAFDWEVKAVRKGHEGFKVIRPRLGAPGDLPPLAGSGPVGMHPASTAPPERGAEPQPMEAAGPATRGGEPLQATGPGTQDPEGPAVQRMPAVEGIEPGDVLVLNPANGDELYRCNLPADPMVVGVAAAGEFGVRSSEFGDREGGAQLPASDFQLPPAGVGGAWLPPSSFLLPVVVGGVTLVKVDATLAPITKGDLLVASGNPGHAMKMPVFAPGTVVGKALEDLPAGTGLIRVLVMLR